MNEESETSFRDRIHRYIYNYLPMQENESYLIDTESISLVPMTGCEEIILDNNYSQQDIFKWSFSRFLNLVVSRCLTKKSVLEKKGSLK